MVLANICAAESLNKKFPSVFRVHEPPSKEKLTRLSHALNAVKLNALPEKLNNQEYLNSILLTILF